MTCEYEKDSQNKEERQHPAPREHSRASDTKSLDHEQWNDKGSDDENKDVDTEMNTGRATRSMRILAGRMFWKATRKQRVFNPELDLAAKPTIRGRRMVCGVSTTRSVFEGLRM